MIILLARSVCTITTAYAATMYQGNGVPVTIRKQPRDTPTATPTATAMRRPWARTAPPETCSALSAITIRDGSATVVANPIAAANAYTKR